jgi:hypothetical protein
VPWVYWVDGIRLSAKQEARRLAFGVLGKQVELRPKGKRPSEATTDYNSDHLPTTSNKRQQLNKYASASTSTSLVEASAAAITPEESTKAVSTTSQVLILLQEPALEQGEQSSTNDDNKEGSMSPIALVNKLQQVAEEQPPHPHPSRTKNGRASVEATAALTIAEPANATEASSEPVDDEILVAIDDDPADDDSDQVPEVSEELISSENENDDLVVDDEEIEVVLDATENPHKEADEAMEKSRTTLQRIETMLEDNKYFCSETRRVDWLQEIQTLRRSDRPQTVIGVLGNTGV